MFQCVSLANIAAIISLIGTVIDVPDIAAVDEKFVKFHNNGVMSIMVFSVQSLIYILIHTTLTLISVQIIKVLMLS